MPADASLDPETRVLYGASLQPPPGYRFDCGVATTFSLDFETALSVPLSLALFAPGDREELLAHPLALIESAERVAGRLAIFADAGRIQAQSRPQSRLCALLEKMIVEVRAQKDGAFHPKIWIIRYDPIDGAGPAQMRLLVLSRNLTRDRSWDVALTLDGVVKKRPFALNKPLVEFLHELPRLAVGDASPDLRDLCNAIAEDLRRTEWELPEPFDELFFTVNGFKRPQIPIKDCDRLGVVSPFCDDQALKELASLSSEPPTLISRADQLVALSEGTLAAFNPVMVLDELAETDDGEDECVDEIDTSALLRGLHAKIYIAEYGWNTEITIGSANATRPALLTGANVEVMATLVGKRSKVGGVHDILGASGFGRLARPFTPNEISPPDAERLSAEHRLDAARRLLCGGTLSLKCARNNDADDDSLWRLSAIPSEALSDLDLHALALWPVTLGDNRAVDALRRLQAGEPVDLGPMSLVDVTRFVGFRATTLAGKTPLSVTFAANLPIDGLPETRDGALLRFIIENKDAFLRYVRLLLADLSDPFAAAAAFQDASNGRWRSSFGEIPMLENMVRSYCRGGDELRAIERLIARLESADAAGAELVPPEFKRLWDSFRKALQEQETSDEA